jgi:hypothetical protein
MAIATKRNAKLVAAYIKKEASLLRFINTTMSSELGAGSGETVNALVPGYGNVTKGEALPKTAAGLDDYDAYGVNVESVPVTVNIYKNAANYGMVDKAVRLNTFDTMVAQPYGSRLAAQINQMVYQAILGAAGMSIVTDTPNFSVLADAIALVATSRVGDRTGGVLGPSLMARITNSGLNEFGQASAANQLWKGTILGYNGVDFTRTPDAALITVPAGITAVAIATAPTEGASTLAITLTGAAEGAVIPAGYAFRVPGVYALDVFGKSTGELRTFVAAEDFTVGANGAATMPIEPIFAASKTSKKNVSALPGAVTANMILEAGATYQTGAVFADKCVAFASIAPAPMDGQESSTSDMEGELNVRMTRGSSITDGKIIVRWDVLCGVKRLYGNGAVAIYAKVG